MEKIISAPGLQHLAEKVFWKLKVEDLKICAQINQSCKRMLEDAIFWLRKFGSLSKESQNDWIIIIQSVKNSAYEKIIISYLQWNLAKELVVDLPCFWFKKFRSLSKKNQRNWIKVIESEKNSKKEKAIMDYLQWKLNEEALVKLPCYSSPAVQNYFRKKIMKICGEWESSDKDTEIVKILAPLTNNPNAPDGRNGETPIHRAAENGHTEIVKILAPLTDNPNASDKGGLTPIYWAALKGFKEIIKILAPLTDNPNASDKDGLTPIYGAACYGHIEIVKILAPLTDNPNVPDKWGTTPIHAAACKGHTEIVKLLAPLSDNHIAPIEVAKDENIFIFNKSTKRKAGPRPTPFKKRAKKF